MARFTRLVGRIVPALLIAGGVTLLAAGLLSYTAPPATGVVGSSASATAIALSPSPAASPTEGPTGSGSVRPTPVLPTDRPTPTPTSTARPTPDEDAVATRVVVPALDIDLPVVSGELDPPGNPGNYPLCDVAQYLTVQGVDWDVVPGREGTTYLFAHAREGMFLPLLLESQREDGAGMLGALAQVYTRDEILYLYEISVVKRHATDFDLATDLEEGEHRLILQTSEGPSGTVPKLQVAARLIDIQELDDPDPDVVAPEPHPRICG
ncbi:MAG: hypothetical protein H0X16_07940 [Chloroflexi bacterium]|nr:hypothetical protein [Chloroflexota bacterium]